MKVLVGCEFSGTVRRAFREQGHDAWSCDLLPADDGSPFHIQGDVLDVLDRDWQVAIFHPPCTYLTVSGNRWMTDPRYPNRAQDREDAVAFFLTLWTAPIPRIAIENPIGVMSSRLRKPDQVIQPWMFGHGETKATCLWLKNLPPLFPTWIEGGREQRIFRLPPSEGRWKLRSETFQGIADAFAAQWGALEEECVA